MQVLKSCTLFTLYYCFQQFFNIRFKSQIGCCALVVGILAQHCCNVALAVAVRCQLVVVLLAVVGIALYLLLALAAQVAAYRLHDAHCHSIHYVMSLYIEICLFGFYAKGIELFVEFFVLLNEFGELLFEQLYVVLHAVVQLLQ